MKLFKWMNRHKLLVFLFIILGVCFGGFLEIKRRLSKIETKPIIRGDISFGIYGSAQLKSDKNFDLKLGVNSKIIGLKKMIGDKVRKGELLVEFESLPNFHAPMDGLLTSINFNEGETAFAQAPILSITSPEKFYLQMSLDQKSLRFVKVGLPVRISFEGYRDLKIEGTVRSIYSSSQEFYAIIDLLKFDPSFLPGMSADVAIIVEHKTNVLKAPTGAIKDGTILIFRGHQKDEIPVVVGIEDGTFSEITSPNIREGDLAVIRSSVVGLPFIEARN